jgi:hypothetical protein
MIFLDGFIIVVVAFSSQKLVVLFSKLVLLFLIESSSPTTFEKTKHFEKTSKLHLHYNVNPLLAPQAQSFCHPYFIIGLRFSNSIPKFEHFTNKKK